MKIRNILCMLFATVFAVACVNDDWDIPSMEQVGQGNSQIENTNEVTLSKLYEMYPNYSKDDTTYMNQPAQLKVYVTGNDIQGNLYNNIAVQDDEGNAIIICVQEGNMFSYLPVGQQLLIETQGLYIGSYGGQPQIGVPYTNSNGKTFPSRMSSATWQNHYRLIKSTKHIQTKAENEANPLENAYVIPEYTAKELKALTVEHAGKLMTVKDVVVNTSSGKPVWAAEEDASINSKTGKRLTTVSKYFKGEGQNIMTYTSTYADFAGYAIPEGKLNLTGIWKWYNGKWELVLRSIEDVEIAE